MQFLSCHKSLPLTMPFPYISVLQRAQILSQYQMSQIRMNITYLTLQK